MYVPRFELSFVVRWDPQNPDLTFFDQSAVLYTQYFYVQILVHRPFVTHLAARTSSSIAYLAICANAARSCTRVMDTQSRRGRVTAIPTVMVGTFLEYYLTCQHLYRMRCPYLLLSYY
jgi:hypothetical protein